MWWWIWLVAEASSLPDEIRALQARGLHARAIHAARQYLGADATDAERWVLLGELELEPGQAELLFREALRLEPRSVPALLGLARARRSQGDAGEALRLLEEARALAPEALAPRLLLAEATGDAALAHALLEQHPQDADAALLVARLDPTARQRVLRAAPAEPRVLVARVEAELAAGDALAASEALALLEQRVSEGLEIYRPELERLRRFVDCARQETLDGATFVALHQLRREAIAVPGQQPAVATVQAPRCAAALALQASMASGPEAVSLLREALALGPDPGLEVMLGRALLAGGEPWAALAPLSSATQARPWDASALLLYAEALRGAGEAEAARAALQEGAARFPDHPGLVLARAELAPSREQALEILLGGLSRLYDPVLEERARALSAELDQPDALMGVAPPDPKGLALLGDFEEIVVVGERESQVRRDELTAKLQSMGYGEPRPGSDGSLFFEGNDRDRPWVLLRSDGSFDVQDRSGSRQRIGATRKYIQARVALVDAMAPELRAWRDALCREAVEDRLLSEIPAALVALWEEGTPRSGTGYLETPEQRRAELLDWWATRTCTPEGARVRQAIAKFIETEVQISPWPVTEEELLATNARRNCDEPLVLAR